MKRLLALSSLTGRLMWGLPITVLVLLRLRTRSAAQCGRDGAVCVHSNTYCGADADERAAAPAERDAPLST